MLKATLMLLPQTAFVLVKTHVCLEQPGNFHQLRGQVKDQERWRMGLIWAQISSASSVCVWYTDEAGSHQKVLHSLILLRTINLIAWSFTFYLPWQKLPVCACVCVWVYVSDGGGLRNYWLLMCSVVLQPPSFSNWFICVSLSYRNCDQHLRQTQSGAEGLCHWVSKPQLVRVCA